MTKGLTIMEKNYQEEIPQYVIEGFARMILPEIRKFYESEEGKEFFEKCKAENMPDTESEK